MKRAKYLSILLYFAYSCIIGYFCFLAPWVGDDIEYKFIASAHQLDMSNTPIRSISDIFYSQWLHYFSVNGRSIAHVLVQLFCAIIGRNGFVSAQILAMFVFLLLIGKITNANWKQPKTAVLIILLTSVTFRTYYTPSCQIGYVWMFCLCMGFIYFYHGNHSFRRWYQYCFLFLLSFIAGWGQEALNIGIAGALCLDIVIKAKRLTTAQWLMLSAFGAGVLLICLSPAAWRRADSVHIQMSQSILNLMRYARTLYLMAGYILLLKLKKASLKRILYKNYFYITALFILLLFNLIIGIQNNRQLFGIELLSILIILRLSKQYKFIDKTSAYLILALTCASFFTVFKEFYFLKSIRQAYDRTMENCLKAPDHSIVLHHYCPSDTLWPGKSFLTTMQKEIFLESGKTIHIIPASIYYPKKRK